MAIGSYSAITPEVHEMDEVRKKSNKPWKKLETLTGTPGETSLLRWWAVEFAMSALAIIAFVALVAILGVEDGQPQRQWGPLTLNSIDTILATVISSSVLAVLGGAMSQNLWNYYAQPRGENKAVTRAVKDLEIFDDASRGPMGSLKLLIQKPKTLAALGAFTILLNLAFVTFAQQLISSTQVSQVLTDGIAKPFARSEMYQAISDYQPVPGVPGAIPSAVVDYSTQAAILGAGVQGNNAVQSQPTCSSGNCFFSSGIPSLALCSSCTDVSHHLDNQGTCDWNLPPCNVTEDGFQSSDFCGAVGDACSYSLPNGLSLDFQPGYNASQLFAFWNATNIPVADSLAYNNTENSFAMTFSTLGLPESVATPLFANGSGTGTSGTLPPMQAQECAIWFCLNLYSVSVTNGKSSIEVISNYSVLGTLSSGPGFGFYDSGLGGAQVYPGYGVASDQDFNAMGTAMNRLIPSGISYVYAESGLQFPQTADGEFNFVQGLYHASDNLQNWTQNLALAVTNNMASLNPATDTAQFDGEVLASATRFKIRWYWITLPVVVLILTIVFLLLTILQTQRSFVRPWKANPLALLFADIDRDISDKVAATKGFDRDEGIRKTVGSKKVGLHRRASGGLSFSGSPDPSTGK